MLALGRCFSVPLELCKNQVVIILRSDCRCKVNNVKSKLVGTFVNCKVRDAVNRKSVLDNSVVSLKTFSGRPSMFHPWLRILDTDII